MAAPLLECTSLAIGPLGSSSMRQASQLMHPKLVVEWLLRCMLHLIVPQVRARADIPQVDIQPISERALVLLTWTMSSIR